MNLTWIKSDSTGSRTTKFTCICNIGNGILLAGTTGCSSLNSGQIWKSEDSGKTWTLLNDFNNQYVVFTIYSISYLGNGNIIASSGSVGGDAGYIFYSHDYGITWTQTTVYVSNRNITASCNLTSGNAVCGFDGPYGRGGGEIWRTYNYGEYWQRAYQPTNPGYYIKSLYAIGSNIVLAGIGSSSGYAGILRSTDNGVTWSQISIDNLNMDYVSCFSIINGIEIWAGTNNSSNLNAYIYRSLDNGLTWSHFIPDVNIININSICDLGSNKIVISTDGIIDSSSYGAIYYSNNGGNDWKKYTINDSIKSINNVYKIGNDVLVSTYRSPLDLGEFWTGTFSEDVNQTIVFSFSPNMINCIEEGFEYLTDILISWNNSEQRIQLLENPRKYLKFTPMSIDFNESIAIQNIINAIGDKIIYVPWWVEIYDLKSKISSNDNFIMIDTTQGNLRIGDQIIIWKNYSLYEIFTIIGISNSSITINSAISKSYNIGEAIVMPVKFCRTSTSQTIDFYTHGLNQCVVKFYEEQFL